MATELNEMENVMEELGCYNNPYRGRVYDNMIHILGKNILDFNDEQELYNELMNVEGKCYNVPKYKKQAFLNMCILLRNSKGLSSDILKSNIRKDAKANKHIVKKPRIKHTLEMIENYVYENTGNQVKDALRYIINFLRFNVKHADAFRHLEIGKIWTGFDIGEITNMLIFADEDSDMPKQVFYYYSKGDDFTRIEILNCDKLHDSLKIIWDYAVINKKYCKKKDEEYSSFPFYFEILEEINTKKSRTEQNKIMNDYILTYSYSNWVYGKFCDFIEKNKLLRGNILCRGVGDTPKPPKIGGHPQTQK